MGASTAMQELDDRLNSELDPFEDMCGPKSVSHGTITSWKEPNRVKTSKSPVKKALMLRPPTSQTISDMAALQNEKSQLCQQMKQMEAWVKNAEARHGGLIKANRHMRLTLEKADKELEMSRLKQDKLSELVATAEAGRQTADQRSRRLEIKFARSDKGHALMQSAKLQTSVTALEKQVAQLQTDAQHKVPLPRVQSLRGVQGELLAQSQIRLLELHRALTQRAHQAGLSDEDLLVANSNLEHQLEASRQQCKSCDEQTMLLRQQLNVSQNAEADAVQLRGRVQALEQQAAKLEQQCSAAVHQADSMQQLHHEEVAEIQSRSRAEVLRGTEQLGQLQREAEERLAAMRTQLEHQEIDKAALLDIVQDLEERQTPAALAAAQTQLKVSQDQVARLQQQVQQTQSAVCELSSTKTQLILLQSELHQQRELCHQQAAAHEALSVGLEQERSQWQHERQSLVSRAQGHEIEVSKLQHSAQTARQESQKNAAETRKISQQFAVAQADLRSTRHQLKVLQQQGTALQPAPLPDAANEQQQRTALQEQVDSLLLQLDSKSQEVRNMSQARALLASELNQAGEIQIKAEARLKAQLQELREDLESKAHMITALQAELGAQSDELQAMRDEATAQMRSSLDRQTADNSLLASQNASLQADLRAKSLELHTAAEEYANLEALTKCAADEQAANEEHSVKQIMRLQHEAKELKGVQGACEVLEQTVAHLKRRLNAEEVMRAELTGKLQNAGQIPAELQLQLQQAQQQNQTLARILAKECEQAAAHVESQQQLQVVWHHLVSAHHLPAGATIQEQAALLAQMLASPQPRLTHSDSQLSPSSQQLQQAQPLISGHTVLPVGTHSHAASPTSIDASSFPHGSGLHPPHMHTHTPAHTAQPSSQDSADLQCSTTTIPQSVDTVHPPSGLSYVTDLSSMQQDAVMHAALRSSGAQPSQSQYAVQHGLGLDLSQHLYAAQPAVSRPGLDPGHQQYSGQHWSAAQSVLPSLALAPEVSTSPSLALAPEVSTSPSLALAPEVSTSPSLDPGQRLYVAQRVKELQSRQSSPLSPERSASSLSSMLSPRPVDWRAGSASAAASPRHSQQQPSMFSSPRSGAEHSTSPSATPEADGLTSPADRLTSPNTRRKPEGLTRLSPRLGAGGMPSQGTPGTALEDSGGAHTAQSAGAAAAAAPPQILTSTASQRVTAASDVHKGSLAELPAEDISLRQKHRVRGPGQGRAARLQGWQSVAMPASLPGYDPPADPELNHDEEDETETGGIEMSSSAFELQPDDEASVASQHAHPPDREAEAGSGARPLSEDSANFGPEASVLSLSDTSQHGADVTSVSGRSDQSSMTDGSKQSDQAPGARQPTLKQQLSDLHNSFRQARARFTPNQSRQLSRQSSAGRL